jgi:hypothetical protein
MLGWLLHGLEWTRAAAKAFFALFGLLSRVVSPSLFRLLLRLQFVIPANSATPAGNACPLAARNPPKHLALALAYAMMMMMKLASESHSIKERGSLSFLHLSTLQSIFERHSL